MIFRHPFRYNFGDQIALLNLHLFFNRELKLDGTSSIQDVHQADDLLLAKLFFGRKATDSEPTHLFVQTNVVNDICYSASMVLSEVYK